MANRQQRPVSYRPFRVDPLLPDGLLGVARQGGELERKVADFFFRVADAAGERVERQRLRDGELAGKRAALEARPRTTIAPGEPAEEAPRPSGRSAVRFSGSRQQFIDALMPAAVEASRRTGVDPRIIVAQAALESGWGKKAPGNNFFGIKSHGQGGGQTFTTHEVINGRRVKIRDSFRRYGSADESVAGYADFILRNQRYTAFRQARGLDAQLGALQASGYATDPHYGAKIGHIARNIAFSGRPTAQSTAAPGITASGGGFRPTGGQDAYSRAYDAAGTRTYLQMLDAEIRSTTRQAFDLHKEDPAALSATLDALKAEQLAEHVPEEIRAEYEIAFEQARETWMVQAERNAERRTDQENLAGFDRRTADLSTQLARDIATMDPDSPQAAAALQSSLTAIDDHYDTAVVQDIMRPDAAETAKREARRSTAVSFYLRQAEGRGAGEIGTMRADMEEAFGKGELDGIDADGWAVLSAKLASLEKTTRAADEAESAAIEKLGEKLADRAAEGYDIGQEELGEFVKRAGQHPEALRGTLIKLQAAQRIRDLPIAEARRHVRDRRDRLGTEPSAEAVAAQSYMEGLLARTEKALATDPVGYGERMRVIGPTGDLAAAQAEELPALMEARRAAAERVAAHYGVAPRYLKPGEAKALTAAAKADPEAGAALAGALVSGAGPAARAMLAEFGPSSAMMTQAGAIMADGGSADAARDVIAGHGRNADGKAWKDVAAAARAEIAATAIGSALAGSRADRLRIEDAAAKIARSRLAEAGVEPDGPEARSIYRDALDEAAGGFTDRGNRYGGFTTIGGSWWRAGRPVLVPNTMRADLFDDVLEALADEDLAALGLDVADATGRKARAVDYREATPVAVPGGYAFAQGAPEGDQPLWIARDGRPVILDMERLRRLYGERVPGAWR